MLTFVKDVGMGYTTAKPKWRNHFSLYLCSGCNEEYEFRTAQIKLGYTNFCVNCNPRNKSKAREG